MTSFAFDIPPDAPLPRSPSFEEQRIRQAWEDRVLRLHENQRQQREEKERQAALPKERAISLRMPTAMIERLDAVASDAATNRSHLLRQITSDFLNYVWANGISFRGSLIGFKHPPLHTDDDE